MAIKSETPEEARARLEEMSRREREGMRSAAAGQAHEEVVKQLTSGEPDEDGLVAAGVQPVTAPETESAQNRDAGTHRRRAAYQTKGE